MVGRGGGKQQGYLVYMANLDTYRNLLISLLNSIIKNYITFVSFIIGFIKKYFGSGNCFLTSKMFSDFCFF